jgi:hypothetical protein
VSAAAAAAVSAAAAAVSVAAAADTAVISRPKRKAAATDRWKDWLHQDDLVLTDEDSSGTASDESSQAPDSIAGSASDNQELQDIEVCEGFDDSDELASE